MSEQPEQPSPKAPETEPQQRAQTTPEADSIKASIDNDANQDHSSEPTEETEDWDIEDLPTELIMPPELSNVFEDHSVLPGEIDSSIAQTNASDSAPHFEQLLDLSELDDPTDLNQEIPTVTEQWKRLHPSRLFINILPQMWSTIRNA